MLKTRHIAPRHRHRRYAAVALTAPLAFCSHDALAQSTSRGSPQLETPGAVQLMDQERSTLARTPGTAAFVEPNSFLRWGPFTARPHFNAGVSYSTGLRSRIGSTEDSLSETIAPGILIELGPKWTLDYTPSLTYYSSRTLKDNLAHSVSLAGHASYGDWAFSLSQTYSTSSQPLLETGRQTDQESFGTGISASRYLNSKLMLQLGFNQNISSAEQFTSTRSWSSMNWLNYQVASRVSIGAGLGGGYEDVNVGHDMTFEQIQSRLDVRISQKLNLSLNGGGEIRQIIGVDGDPLVNPIYGASIIYHPFTYTTLSLSGNRTISASLLADQITESSDVSIGLSQRLFGAVSGSLGASYRNTRFILSNNTQALNRSDDSVTFSAGLGYAFMKRASIGVGYSYNENSSSDRAFSQSSHNVSANLGYHF